MLARLQNALITSCAASRIQFRVSGSGRAEKARDFPGPFLKKRTLWRAHAFTTDAAGAKYYGSRRIAISN